MRDRSLRSVLCRARQRRSGRTLLLAALTAGLALTTGPVALASPAGGGGPMWRLQSPVVPADSIASDLGSVSCVLAGTCAAVGTYERSGGTSDTVAEIWNGSAWAISSTPDPAKSDLIGVSCPAAKSCVAVGDVESGGRNLPLAERWSGGGWTAERLRYPAGATISSLSSVSCPSRKACTAVGVTGTPESPRLFAEHWNGTRWQLQHPPTPRGHAPFGFNSVSCASARACMAVGTFTPGMFTESSRGSTWTVRKIRVPAGGKDGSLGGVSCTAANACTAVGEYFKGSRYVPLAERWNGRSWAVEHVTPPPSGEFGYLASVSCAGPRNCVAAGEVGASVISDKLLVERWTGRSWAVQSTPTPVGAQVANFGGVSCPSVFSCEGVGLSVNRDEVETLLAERYS